MKKTNILLILLLMLSIIDCSQKTNYVAYAVFKDSTLTFCYDDKKPEGTYDVEKVVKDELPLFNKIVYRKEWATVCHEIKTAVFDKSFKEYRPTSCCCWFFDCENLTSIKGIKENINTSEVTDMSEMFGGCGSLTSLDVSGFNTDKVTNMGGMFSGCSNLSNLNVSGFNTENVTDMSFMFDGCANLSSIDVSGFKTDNVTDMWGMFLDCENLTSLDVSGFNTENVTDMWDMFSHCENLTSLDISGFNTGNVTDMSRMFLDCETLKTIYVGNGWNISNVTKSKDMFNNCPNLVGGQGTKFDENHLDVDYAHIDGGESNPGYLTKKTK